MSGHGWRVRLQLFLYGNGNIAGCALALFGPALLFAGVIESWWLPITAGLYAAGWLLVGRPRAVQRRIEDSVTLDEMRRRLDLVVTQAEPHLTPEMRASLESLRGSIEEVLPRLVGTDNPELYTVKETVLRYLPETLANYVELPPVFRTTRALKDGKTAKVLLGEQLSVLDDRLKEVVASVAASDATALVANGRFLESKFRQPDFLAAP